MLCVSDDSYTATVLPPRVFLYKNFSLKLAKLFFFLFLISSSKRQHSFLKLAKDGFTSWYRYKLVKSNMAQSRELAFGTLLGNETTESGKNSMSNLFCLISIPVFYRFCQRLWKSVAQYHFGNNTGIFTGAEQIFQLKECLVHHKNVPAQEGRFTRYSWQREKKSLRGNKPISPPD